MASESLTICGICHEDFDRETRCPRILPCSHYLCTNCISSLIKRHRTGCPFCRKDFEATSVEDVVVNRAILNFLTDSSPNGENVTGYRAKVASLANLRRDTEEEIGAFWSSADVAKANVESYLEMIKKIQEDLGQKDHDIIEVLSKVKEIEAESVKTKENISYNIKGVNICLQDIKRYTDTITKTTAKLEKAQTFKDAGVLMDRVQEVTIAMKANSEKFHQVYAKETLQHIQKDTQKRRNKVGKVLEVLNDHSSSVIPPVLEMPHRNISIQDLRNVTKSAVDLATDGKLFAVHHEKGLSRYAKITIRDNYFQIHQLEEIEPPLNSVLLEHSEVLTLVNPSERIAFLELICPCFDAYLGTLDINLSPDTQGARQFALLCNGEMGPTYANTRLLSVICKGYRGERVKFGDYEFQNGSGGKPLLDNLTLGEEYRRPIVPGVLVGLDWWIEDSSKSAQFMIHTGDKTGKMSMSAFGRVVDGLYHLFNVVNLFKNIKDVSIGDCGLVLVCKS